MSDGNNDLETTANRLLQERVARLRRSMEEAVQSLLQPLDLPPDSGSGTGGTTLRALRDALESIAAGGSQRDILTALLGVAGSCYPRTALFVVKRETLLGWAGRGFDAASGFSDADIPRVALPVAGDHLLARAIQSRDLVLAGSEGPGDAIASALGGVAPHESGAMPLLLRDKPVAVLFGDTGRSGGPAEALWFEVIGRVGGLALGTLAGDAPRRVRSATTATPAQAPDRFATAGAASAGEPGPVDDTDVQALVNDLEQSAADDPAGGSPPVNEEMQQFHDDARRFASLLVSELMLYNEEAVIQGRRNRDLYRRLSVEIQRSRQAYTTRIPAAVARSTQFLEDELVRVLAEGDASLLAG